MKIFFAKIEVIITNNMILKLIFELYNQLVLYHCSANGFGYHEITHFF